VSPYTRGMETPASDAEQLVSRIVAGKWPGRLAAL